jgi:dipeptidase
VIDPGEVWIFQVLPDDSQRSAVWCAQRVPDDHVAVVANSFTIRDVDLTNQQDFLCSSNVEAVAARTGRWAPGRPLDFAAVFSGPEHGKKYSTGRRMWRIYNLLGDPAAAAALPETYTEFVSAAPYPPSLVTVPASLRVTNLTNAMRDQYEGTRFDMTTGMAAGPAGTPDRWLPGAGEAEVLGAWERAISLSRTIVSYVIQSRGWLPREVGGTLWFSVHAAHTSLYIPFPVGHTLPGTPSLPPGLTNNSLGAVGRGVSFYQASRFVHNAAQHRFSHAIQVVKATQRGLERSASALQAEQVAQYVNGSATIAEVAAQFNQNAVDMVAAWWSLADQLVVTVGCDSGHDGYPAWWLRAPDVGYTDGPPPAPPVPTVPGL